MHLPVNPPILPMLAKRVEEIPPCSDWIFEPKWDGFRVLIFRDHKEILIQSREQKSLNRYFPEMLPPLLQQLPTRCVVDGELVIARKARSISMHCNFASTRPPQGSTSSQTKLPRPLSCLMCCAKGPKTCAWLHFINVANVWKKCSPTQHHHFT